MKSSFLKSKKNICIIGYHAQIAYKIPKNKIQLQSGQEETQELSI